MKMQKSRAKCEKVCRVADLFDEHYTPAFAQASLGLCHPGTAFSFTSQFMNGQQSKHHVGRIRGQRPGIVTRWQAARDWGEHRARSTDGRLGHLLLVKMIEKLPLHAPKPFAECRRRLIKSAMAKNWLAHAYSSQGAFEPAPAIKI